MQTEKDYERPRARMQPERQEGKGEAQLRAMGDEPTPAECGDEWRTD